MFKVLQQAVKWSDNSNSSIIFIPKVTSVTSYRNTRRIYLRFGLMVKITVMENHSEVIWGQQCPVQQRTQELQKQNECWGLNLLPSWMAPAVKTSRSQKLPHKDRCSRVSSRDFRYFTHLSNFYSWSKISFTGCSQPPLKLAFPGKLSWLAALVLY